MSELTTIFSHLTEPQFLLRYSEYLLLIVIIYSFIEVIFPPLPGDVLLILSGSLAGLADIGSIGIIIAACLGSFLGSWLLYTLGLKMERKMLDSPRLAKVLDSKAFLRVEHWFKRFGFLTLVASRFIPVVRSGIILAAGMVGLDRRKSLIAVGISIILSTSLLVLGGRFVGHRWQKLVDLWHSNLRAILWIAVGLVLGYLVIMQLVKYLKSLKKD